MKCHFDCVFYYVTDMNRAIVGRQNLSEFLCKILRDTFVKYKHYLDIPFLDSDDVSDSLFYV